MFLLIGTLADKSSLTGRFGVEALSEIATETEYLA
jgi:hypothetical protein